VKKVVPKMRPYGLMSVYYYVYLNCPNKELLQQNVLHCVSVAASFISKNTLVAQNVSSTSIHACLIAWLRRTAIFYECIGYVCSYRLVNGLSYHP
jgi:hypothetical protein